MTAAPRRSIGERLYRRLLRLYPRAFHDEYTAEMVRLYRDRARDEGVVALWVAVLSDLSRTKSGHLLRSAFYVLRSG